MNMKAKAAVVIVVITVAAGCRHQAADQPASDSPGSNGAGATVACERYIRTLLPTNPLPKFHDVEVVGEDPHYHVNGSVTTADQPYTSDSMLLTKYWSCDMTSTSGNAEWHVDSWVLR